MHVDFRHHALKIGLCIATSDENVFATAKISAATRWESTGPNINVTRAPPSAKSTKLAGIDQ
jgi:hypothetical protein